MGLHLLDIYRSPNIGVFLRANDKFVLVPKGLAESKCAKLAADLSVSVCYSSIAGSRLLGPLVAMNNNGVIVSRLAEPAEMREISSAIGLNVEHLDSRFTAAGNLIAANDKHAIVSPLLDTRAADQVHDLLGTEVHRMAVREYAQVGSLISTTNSGAAIYPRLEEEEVSRFSEALGVEAYPTSINGGVPYVASGIVANSRNAVVGYLTTGPELVFITRALKV